MYKNVQNFRSKLGESLIDDIKYHKITNYAHGSKYRLVGGFTVKTVKRYVHGNKKGIMAMPSYKKDNGSWYCSFYYTDYQGARKKKKKEGFKTKKESESWEREFILKYSGSPDMTFESLYQLYMDDSKSRVKPTTYRNKELIIDSRILPYFREKPINAISPLDVRRWQTSLIGEQVTKGDRSLGEDYINKLKRTLSAIFNYAVKYYNLPSNPCKNVDNLKVANKSEMKIWTEGQFLTFLEGLDDRQFKLPFMILFYCGLRKGELYALTWGDVDLEKRTIDINKTLGRVSGEGEYIGSTKTEDSNRIIKIPQVVVDEFKDFRSRTYAAKEEYRIFQHGNALYRDTLIQTAMKQGLDPIRIHDLRHSHISHLIYLGVDIISISRRVGHASPSITLDTYGHLYQAAEDKVIDLLDKSTKSVLEK